MKTRWAIFLVVGMALVSVRPAPADYPSAGYEVRAGGDFYEPLAPLGRWVQVNPYGWCWYPSYVESDWRPYTNGCWVWTDGGWYWMSEEPWAWATYHYGRWVYDSYYGWLWVPGTEWAPSWVSWREGGEYIGWAPLPPSCGFAPQQTVIYAEEVVYAPNTFVFIERRRFCEPIRPSCLTVNQTIVNQTINVTKIKKVDQVIINQGPQVNEVRRYAKGGLPVVRVSDLRANMSPQRREERTVRTEVPRNPQRDFQREMPAARRNERPVVTVAPPDSPRPHDVRTRDYRPDRVKPNRDDGPRNVVIAPEAPVVAQAAPDNGKPDKHHKRDIDDDSPRHGRR